MKRGLGGAVVHEEDMSAFVFQLSFFLPCGGVELRNQGPRYAVMHDCTRSGDRTWSSLPELSVYSEYNPNALMHDPGMLRHTQISSRAATKEKHMDDRHPKSKLRN
jgi:hypothetical protein